jgi:hypothetical protein
MIQDFLSFVVIRTASDLSPVQMTGYLLGWRRTEGNPPFNRERFKTNRYG